MSHILYGGLFDPPHLGHLKIARAAYDLIKPEKLIWILSKCPPHREIEGSPADKRLNMLELLLKNKPEFAVSDIELDEGHSGCSVETVRMFWEKYPDKKSYFLIGSDEAESFKNWKEWQKILQMTTLVIGRRKKNADIPIEIKSNAVFLDNEIFDISSAQIRKNLNENKSMEGFVGKEVAEYIKQQNLYR